MARKKNKRPKLAADIKSEISRWDTGDKLQLLAYLNWCIQFKQPFETTVADHLEKTIGKRFTFKQIRSRLYKEWHGSAKIGKDRKFNQIFSEGTKVLNDLENPHDQEVFDQIFCRLGEPADRRLTRSGSAALSVRSRAVSAARSTRANASQTSSPQPRNLKKSQLQSKRKVSTSSNMDCAIGFDR